MSPRPRIAITRQRSGETPGQPLMYLEAVRACGGEPEYVVPGRDMAEIIREYQAILIPGGRDLDPARYGENAFCAISPEDPERSGFELELIQKARVEKLPVLGICYGMQVMNVALGGGLYQDIAVQTGSTVINHREGWHEAVVLENPYLPAGPCRINSSHHQAVRSTGSGLVPFATAPDGVVEAIYDPQSAFFVGVQWHPERMKVRSPGNIISVFLEASRE